jgi:ClpX C4-type zinc finger
MVLDQTLLREAKQARDRLLGLQHEAELAQVNYQHTIRRLHGAGGSLREIADALGLSYQRVHQIVDVATGKGAVKECRTTAVCSFCGADKSTARRLIAGPGVLVCEQCIVLAQDLLGEGGERVNEQTRLGILDTADRKARCSFCGKKRQRVASMVEAPDQPPAGKFARSSDAPRICNHCLTLCDEILSEALSN